MNKRVNNKSLLLREFNVNIHKGSIGLFSPPYVHLGSLGILRVETRRLLFCETTP